MNKGLEKFKDNPDIFAICGFYHGEDLGDYQHNYYIDYETCAWGIAYWKDKYENSWIFVKKILHVIFYSQRKCLLYLKYANYGYYLFLL